MHVPEKYEDKIQVSSEGHLSGLRSKCRISLDMLTLTFVMQL
jgi:hypothetical protein